MPIPNLTIIGETINDSVPSTKQLFDAGNIDGLLELARFQDEKGAAYIDVNVGAGRRSSWPKWLQDPVGDGQAAPSTRPIRALHGPDWRPTTRTVPAASGRSSIP